MALTNLRETITDNRLRIPIGEHTYIIEPATAQTWLWLQEVFAGGDGALNEKFAALPESEMHKKTLGKAFDEMTKHNVTLDELRIAGMTAIIDTLQGREFAERYWEAGGNPGNLAALTTQGETTATPEPAAPSTPRRASRSGATAKTRAAKAGPTSSPTGS